MSVVFFCQSCGARFEVDDGLAGRQAKCRKCGDKITIPAARERAAVAAKPAAGEFRLAPEAVAASPAAKAAPPRRPAVPAWIDAVTSRVALAPIADERGPAAGVTARPSPLDDLGDSKPYQMASLSRVDLPRPGSTARVSGAKVVWRRELGGLQRFLRWLNDAAYLVSVPFILMVLVGATFKNRPLALLGAVAVVLLNASRLGTGLFNLVIIPFKDSIVRGILFVIPPFTFIDLYRHWKQFRKPLRRVLEPALTIGLVVLVFVFVPSLRGSGAASESVTRRVISTAEDAKAAVAGKLQRASNIDLQSLESKAERALQGISPESSFGEPDAAGGGGAGTSAPARPRTKAPSNRTSRSR